MSPTQSIKELKVKIQQKEKIAPEDQTLSFGHKPLLDTKKLDDYNIKEGSTLVLGLKLRGGSNNTSADLKEIPVKPFQKPPTKKKKVDKANVEGVLKQMHQEKLIPEGYRDMKHLQESYLAEIDKRITHFGKEYRIGYRIHTSKQIFRKTLTMIRASALCSHIESPQLFYYFPR